MGKIRIKSFDESSVEDEAKLKAKKDAKKAEKTRLQALERSDSGQVAAKNAAKGDVKEVEPTSDAGHSELVSESNTSESEEITVETVISTEPSEPTTESSHPEQSEGSKETKEDKPAKKTKKEKFAKAKARVDSKRHKENLGVVSKTQTYDLDQALTTLKKFKKSKFDETVELHINTKEKGISGQVVLPHGTGKTLVIKIATDEIISEVSKGKINFDILVATPSQMPSLARVAKVLGPRGLMPNPKNGTITDKPEEAVKKLSGGQINYKTESEHPIIHARVGKISFEDNKLKENINTFIASVGQVNIVNVTLKSTMSPGIRLQYA